MSELYKLLGNGMAAAAVVSASAFVGGLYPTPHGLEFLAWKGVGAVLGLGGYGLGFWSKKMHNNRSSKSIIKFICSLIFIYMIALISYNYVIDNFNPGATAYAILVFQYFLLVVIPSLFVSFLGLKLISDRDY